jgi:hypothetical protein
MRRRDERCALEIVGIRRAHGLLRRTGRAGSLGVLLATGCFTVSGASANATALVVVHASGDLDCPEKKIQVEEEVGGRYRAFGCGQKAVYNTACDGLSCVVSQDGKAIPWRDRPDPQMPLPR